MEPPQMVGAIKVIDGIFLGDDFAARVSLPDYQDMELIQQNKVTLIVNCSHHDGCHPI